MTTILASQAKFVHQLDHYQRPMITNIYFINAGVKGEPPLFKVDGVEIVEAMWAKFHAFQFEIEEQQKLRIVVDYYDDEGARYPVEVTMMYALLLGRAIQKFRESEIQQVSHLFENRKNVEAKVKKILASPILNPTQKALLDILGSSPESLLSNCSIPGSSREEKQENLAALSSLGKVAVEYHKKIMALVFFFNRISEEKRVDAEQMMSVVTDGVEIEANLLTSKLHLFSLSRNPVLNPLKSDDRMKSDDRNERSIRRALTRKNTSMMMFSQTQLLAKLPKVIDFSLGLYQNVVFDIGKVILDCNHEEIIRKAFGNTEQLEFYIANVFNSPEWLVEWDQGKIDDEELVYKLSKKLNRDPKELERVIQITKDSLAPIHDSIVLLNELYKMGINLYALTNMSVSAYQHIKAKYEFWDMFKHVTVSSHVGLVKPQKEIYEYLLKKNGLNPKETIFVDDKAVNLKPAEELDISTILFVDAKKCIKDLAKLVGLNSVPETSGAKVDSICSQAI